MKVALVFLAVVVCLKGSHGMFGLSANGQFTTEVGVSIKGTSTAIGLIIPAIVKIETTRNLLSADVTATLKYDLVTMRIYLTSFKAFIDRLGAYAASTAAMPTTAAIINEVKADLDNINTFAAAYKIAVMNIDTALKTKLSDSMVTTDDNASLKTALTAIFDSTTNLIGTVGLTPALINTAIVAADAMSVNKFFTDATKSFGLALTALNQVSNQLTLLVTFQTTLQAAVTPVPMAVASWGTKLIGTATAAQKQFVDLIDKEVKAQRIAITAVETKINAIVDIAETLIVPAVTDNLETFFSVYSGAFTSLTTKIGADLAAVTGLVTANVAKFTADVITTEVKKIVTVVAAKVFGDKGIAATVCVPIFQADFANSLKLEYVDVNSCMTDALQAIPFAFDEYSYLFQQLQSSTTFYLNNAGWCAKYITPTSTPTNNAAMSTCISTKVTSLKDGTAAISSSIDKLDTQLSSDITTLLMTNLDACILAASNAKTADLTYYDTVFDGCAGIM